MSRLLKSFFFAAAVLFATSCGIHRSQSYYDQKSQIIGTELDGSYAIRCWGEGRNSDEALNEVMKKAVYDVVFNGVESGSSSIQSLKPLLLTVNAKDKYAVWSNSFFEDGGDYLKYCSRHDRRAGSSRFVRNRNQVLCQSVVTVDVAALKAALKDYYGIIK